MTMEPRDNGNKRARDDQREPQSDAIVQKSHEVTSNIKQAALDRVDSVKQSAHALRDNTSERVRKLGAAMHKVGEHFRIEDQQYVAEQMTGASKHVNRLADYVDSAELGTMVRDARSLARRNPAFFWGGAFLLGVGAGRFFKGTSLMTGGESLPSRRASKRSLSSDVQDVDAADARASERRRASRAASAGEPARRNRDY